MAIDTSGKWWTGTDAGDIDGYVAELVKSNGGYVPSRFVHAVCSSCAGTVFRVEADPDQYVRRACVSCFGIVEMLDSGDTPENERDVQPIVCPCGDDRHELSVGFALRPGGEVKWVFVGHRCVSDGVLGMFADWKISDASTESLFSSV